MSSICRSWKVCKWGGLVRRRRMGKRLTDKQTEMSEERNIVREWKMNFPWWLTVNSTVLLFFTRCMAICHESCVSHVAYLPSVNYGYLSFSHSQDWHFLLCQFVGADDNSVLWWLIISRTVGVLACVCHFRSHRYTDTICLWRDKKRRERGESLPPLVSSGGDTLPHQSWIVAY